MNNVELPERMPAVGYGADRADDSAACLRDLQLPLPEPAAPDLLVEIEAVSVNPVDTKIRERRTPETGHQVLGYDASGIVRAVGTSVDGFAPGDAVYYAGDFNRPGTNSRFHAVDHRLVAKRPTNLDAAEAASLPLTSITAWELLFDKLRVAEGEGAGETLLVIGGAGGVGSMLIQLATRLTKLTVVATASRDATRDWCRDLGAHHVIDHRESLAEQLEGLGLVVRHVASLTATDRHFDAIVSLLPPFGQLALIDDPGPLDIASMKPKALSLHWAFMFARPTAGGDAAQRQGRMLERVADLVEAGRIRHTMQRRDGPIDAEHVAAAHEFQASGRAIGKTVLEGFAAS